MFHVLREPCLQEDEGQFSYYGSYHTKVEAEAAIRKFAGTFFSVKTFIITTRIK